MNSPGDMIRVDPPEVIARRAKGCDDSCVGPECSHPLCHEGGFNADLIECAFCGLEFCLGHIYRVDVDQHACARCDIEQTTARPITEECARGLLARYGVPFTFRVAMHPTVPARIARISKDTGIIYEGASL